jgi:hypothetical protein
MLFLAALGNYPYSAVEEIQGLTLGLGQSIAGEGRHVQYMHT